MAIPRGRYKRYLREDGVEIPRTTRKRLGIDQLNYEPALTEELIFDDQQPQVLPDNSAHEPLSPTGHEDQNNFGQVQSIQADQRDESLQETSTLMTDCEIRDVTRQEKLLLLEAFRLRHCMSSTAFEDLLNLFNVFYPGSVPGTRYLFDKEFAPGTENIERHVVCDDCSGYIGKEDSACEDCGKEISVQSSLQKGDYFIVLPLQPQLLDLLQTAETFQHLCFPTLSTDQMFTDITNDTNYQNLIKCGHIGNRDLTFIWNSDGVPVFKSSGYSVWPIQCTVNELPPAKRKKHIMLTGVWFGAQKPRMDTFMKPFIDESRQLCTDGFLWINPITGEQETSRAHMLVCTADAIARPMLRNVKQFNGLHGCDWCLHPGERVERGDGNARVYPFCVPEPEMRSDESHRESALNAVQTNEVENGVKGPSVLMLLPCFGIVSGFVPDYMHSVLLGVTRQIVLLWTKGAGTPWYVGNKLDLIDKNLQPLHLRMRLPADPARYS